MFFRDFDMVVRRVSDVVSMTWMREGERQHPKMLYRLEMADGEFRYIDSENFDLISAGKCSYFGAAAGTVLLSVFDYDENGVEEQIVERYPLIGWQIDANGEVRPVTPTRVWTDDDLWSAIMPNGTVFTGNQNLFENEAAFFQHLAKKSNPNV
jgi:hypothetical protein